MVQCHANVMKVILDLTVLIKLVLMDVLVMVTVSVVFVSVLMGMAVLIVLLFVLDQMASTAMEMEDVLMVFVIVNLVSQDMVAI